MSHDCYNLPGLHTKQLMHYRDMCYRFRSSRSYDPTHNNGVHIKLSEILKELNTREHVPNKPEAKLIRRAKAKELANR